MKPEYILLICAGGVFLLLLVIYIIVAFEKSKINKRINAQIVKSYSAENLCKMEYDVAFYEKNVFFFNYNSEEERQVTFDDVLAANEDTSRLAEEAVFSAVEDESEEVIRGCYHPSK